MPEILYQDNFVVAVNKPAGLMVHRSRIDIRATQFAMQLLRDQIGQPVFPVHRIDRPTSGVLLFALNKESARHLSQQFAERSVSKSYVAIVRGWTEEAMRWEEALVEKQDRMTDGKARRNKPAQQAITEFKRLDKWSIPFSAGKYPTSRYSMVEAKPLTGRKHQLRRHFNHMAHPIVGDTTYGDRRHNRLFREQFGADRLLLMAKRLELVHPITGNALVIEAEMDDSFTDAISALQKHEIRTDETA